MNKQEIQTIRTSLKLSQREFAEKIGVSQKTIWQWESGKSEPSDEYMERLTTLSQSQQVVKEGSQGSQGSQNEVVKVVKNDDEVVKEGSQGSKGSQNEVVKVVKNDDEVVKEGSQGSQGSQNEVVKGSQIDSEGSQTGSQGSQGSQNIINLVDTGSQNMVKSDNEGSQGSQNEVVKVVKNDDEVVKTGSQNSEKVVNFDDTGSQEGSQNLDVKLYYETMYQNAKGLIPLCIITQPQDRDKKPSLQVKGFYEIPQIPALLAEADRLNGDYHIYIGIHPLRECPGEGRGKEKDILGVAFFAPDVDAKDFIDNPVEKQKANEERAFYQWTDKLLSECKAKALAHIQSKCDKVSILPTAIIDSGHGYYPIFKLDSFVEFEGDQHREELKKLNKALHEVFAADSTFDFARILRVPNTRNIKPGYPADCKLIEFHSDRCYTLDDIRKFEALERAVALPRLKAEEISAKQEKKQPKRPIEARSLPQPNEVSLKADRSSLSSTDDKKLIEKAQNAKDGAKFTALWEGDISGYDSQSEADLALCCLLAFWTGGDGERIDNLFRQSGLNREKWDREDYRESTINNAIESTTEFYEPNGNNLFQKKKTKEDFCPYFKKDTFIPKLLADDILSDNRFINVKGLLYRYQNGVYIDDGEQFIEAESQNKLGNESRQNRISETVYYIKVDSYTEPERMNPTDKGHLINVQNGLYDWIEGKLLPHDPNHFSTIRIPIEYNPEATCPTVDYFLNSTLPADCVPIAEELFGYALIPYVRFEKAFMFTGNGANGKSTFLTLLEHFVGSKNVSKVPLQDLDEHRFKRAELFGKLLNLFADLDARDLQSSTYFKTIVSGDAIDAERKFQDPFFFRPFARMAFSANEIPKSPDNSYAYFRRWCIIPFPKRFEGKDADKSLADKLTEPAELSGLLNRALNGLHRLFSNEGFTESETIKASLDDYKKQNDTITAFVNDHCIFDSNAAIERGELYTAYEVYCKAEGYQAINRHTCYRKIRAYSQVAEKGDGKKRYFTGILPKQS